MLNWFLEHCIHAEGADMYIYISGFHTWNEKIAITQKKKNRNQNEKNNNMYISSTNILFLSRTQSPQKKNREKKRWEKIPCSYFTEKNKTLLIEDYEKTHVYLKIKKLKRKRQKLKGKKKQQHEHMVQQYSFLAKDSISPE